LKDNLLNWVVRTIIGILYWPIQRVTGFRLDQTLWFFGRLRAVIQKRRDESESFDWNIVLMVVREHAQSLLKNLETPEKNQDKSREGYQASLRNNQWRMLLEILISCLGNPIINEEIKRETAEESDNSEDEIQPTDRPKIRRPRGDKKPSRPIGAQGIELSSGLVGDSPGATGPRSQPSQRGENRPPTTFDSMRNQTINLSKGTRVGACIVEELSSRIIGNYPDGYSKESSIDDLLYCSHETIMNLEKSICRLIPLERLRETIIQDLVIEHMKSQNFAHSAEMQATLNHVLVGTRAGCGVVTGSSYTV